MASVHPTNRRLIAATIFNKIDDSSLSGAVANCNVYLLARNIFAETQFGEIFFPFLRQAEQDD